MIEIKKITQYKDTFSIKKVWQTVHGRRVGDLRQTDNKLRWRNTPRTKYESDYIEQDIRDRLV